MCDRAERLAGQHSLDHLADDRDLLRVLDVAPALLGLLGEVAPRRDASPVLASADVVPGSRGVAVTDGCKLHLGHLRDE
jgi:hypothetical protein